MDISAISNLSQADTNTSIGVAIAKKEMDVQKMEGEGVIQLINSLNPAQGNYINEKM